MTETGRRFLVDGYNAIRRTPRWNDLFLRDLAAAREALMAHCAGLKARHRGIREIVAFFDGDSSVAAPHVPRPPGVRVVFSASGVEADDRIIEAVRRGTPRGTVVVSDDSAVAARARTLGASVLSAAQFEQGRLTPSGKAARQRGDQDAKDDLTPGQRSEINDSLRKAFGIDQSRKPGRHSPGPNSCVGSASRPMNRMLPVPCSRIRNRNG